MTDKIITITSKNQITLPAEYVRQLGLGCNRRLSIRRRGKELIIKPEPSLDGILQEVWDALPPIRGTKDDEELHATSRKAWGDKLA